METREKKSYDALHLKEEAMKAHKGFTLVELMIVVVIVGILASIAVPAYSDYVLRGKLTEASTELAGIRVRLEQYYQDNRNYGSTDTTCGVAMPAAPSVRYFTYACNWGAGGTNQSFTATATGVATEGTGGFAYTIDQNNAKATTAAPAGWDTSASCWITKKGGSC